MYPDVFMFNVFPIIFIIVFIIVISSFIYVFVRSITTWIKNNHSPLLTVSATVVSKRTQNHRSTSNTSTHHHSSGYSTYYATFQFESTDRLELCVPNSEYGYLVEGDNGDLTFQGTRYKNFKRK